MLDLWRFFARERLKTIEMTREMLEPAEASASQADVKFGEIFAHKIFPFATNRAQKRTETRRYSGTAIADAARAALGVKSASGFL